MGKIAGSGSRAAQQPLFQQESVYQYIDRVPASAREGFQQLKQRIELLWNAVVSSIKSCFTDVPFWFFRAVDFFNPPTLTSRIELAWVYASKHWNQFWGDRRESELVKQNQMLKTQNKILAARTQQLTTEIGVQRIHFIEDYDHLRLDRDAILQDRDSILREKNLLDQLVSSLNRTNKIPADGIAAIRDLLSPEEARWLMPLLNSTQATGCP